ncbi:hypothetical protein [Streptomyces sp. x-80]|uniref:hypothetical protein n=1 Tax=Streptomyces sp. x-80 TaxID=2789282 RepID=UPI003980D727
MPESANGGDPEAAGFTRGEQVGALQQGVADVKDRLDPIMPHEVTAMDETESRRWFADGRALFMRNRPVEYASVAGELKAGVRFDVAELPGRPTDGRRMSVLGGQNLAISADSTRPNGARALIEGADRSGRRTLPAGAGVRRDPRPATRDPRLGVPGGGEGARPPAGTRGRRPRRGRCDAAAGRPGAALHPDAVRGAAGGRTAPAQRPPPDLQQGRTGPGLRVPGQPGRHGHRGRAGQRTREPEKRTRRSAAAADAAGRRAPRRGTGSGARRPRAGQVATIR